VVGKAEAVVGVGARVADGTAVEARLGLALELAGASVDGVAAAPVHAARAMRRARARLESRRSGAERGGRNDGNT
jgi:hypothetical protein